MRIGLSWRVQVLPHLGDAAADALYKRFNLEEPWDGPTNKPLMAEMPAVFAPVRGRAEPGHTYYQGFADHWTEADGSPHRAPLYYTGVDAALFPDPRSLLPTDGTPSRDGRILPTRRAGQVIDGPAHTILAVEAGRAVPWSKPEDVPVSGGRQTLRATGTWSALGGLFDGEASGVLLDGRVFVVKPGTPPEKLRPFIVADDGQPPDFAAIGLTPQAK